MSTQLNVEKISKLTDPLISKHTSRLRRQSSLKDVEQSHTIYFVLDLLKKGLITPYSWFSKWDRRLQSVKNSEYLLLNCVSELPSIPPNLFWVSSLSKIPEPMGLLPLHTFHLIWHMGPSLLLGLGVVSEIIFLQSWQHCWGVFIKQLACQLYKYLDFVWREVITGDGNFH